MSGAAFSARSAGVRDTQAPVAVVRLWEVLVEEGKGGRRHTTASPSSREAGEGSEVPPHLLPAPTPFLSPGVHLSK